MLDAAKYADINAQSAAFRSDYLKRQEIEADRLAALARANAANDAATLDKLNFEETVRARVTKSEEFNLANNLLNAKGADRSQKGSNKEAIISYLTALELAARRRQPDQIIALLKQGLKLPAGKGSYDVVKEMGLKNKYAAQTKEYEQQLQNDLNKITK